MKSSCLRCWNLLSVLTVALGMMWIDEASAQAASVKNHALPKVRVAPDSQTFTVGKQESFVPMGVTYYRPGTGWAPQVWKQFDREATRQDFVRMRELGVNCVRVFLTFGSFYRKPGELNASALAKFDEFLTIAEEAGIYVHPTGPDHWEGMPDWNPAGIEDERTLAALEEFWRLFAARYRGRSVIFAYDLKNEPEVGWNDRMKPAWNAWLARRYGGAEAIAKAWGRTNAVEAEKIPVPEPADALKNRELLDFQLFREDLADEWTRRQVAAIKSADPEALVTVGMIQWSVPALLPSGVRHYAAFRPHRQAGLLDFLEVHFYPLADGAYEYQGEEQESKNLAYLESVVREVAAAGKPVVLAEFGWYGGGKPKFNGGRHPEATERQQAEYCRKVVRTSAGFACGWLNWGFFDQPEATDCSELTGLATADGRTKEWGKTFRALAEEFEGQKIPAKEIGARPVLDWEACVTSAAAGKEFQRNYWEAFRKDPF